MHICRAPVVLYSIIFTYYPPTPRSDVEGVILVIDSSDKLRIVVAREELQSFLQHIGLVFVIVSIYIAFLGIGAVNVIQFLVICKRFKN